MQAAKPIKSAHRATFNWEMKLDVFGVFSQFSVDIADGKAIEWNTARNALKKLIFTINNTKLFIFYYDFGAFPVNN